MPQPPPAGAVRAQAVPAQTVCATWTSVTYIAASPGWFPRGILFVCPAPDLGEQTSRLRGWSLLGHDPVSPRIGVSPRPNGSAPAKKPWSCSP
jgi:hypothetical protein